MSLKIIYSFFIIVINYFLYRNRFSFSILSSIVFGILGLVATTFLIGYQSSNRFFISILFSFSLVFLSQFFRISDLKLKKVRKRIKDKVPMKVGTSNLTKFIKNELMFFCISIILSFFMTYQMFVSYQAIFKHDGSFYEIVFSFYTYLLSVVYSLFIAMMMIQNTENISKGILYVLGLQAATAFFFHLESGSIPPFYFYLVLIPAFWGVVIKIFILYKSKVEKEIRFNYG